MAPVHQDGQLDLARPRLLQDRVERGAGSAAGEEHVVHQDDHTVIQHGGQRNGRRLWSRGPAWQIVAVWGDIQRSGGNADSLQIADASRRVQESIDQVLAVAEHSSASAEEVSATTEQTSASTQEIAASAIDLRQTAEQLARRIDTINYEVLCGISGRVPRVYHRDGSPL